MNNTGKTDKYMADKKAKAALGRRDVLKVLGLGAGAAVVSVAPAAAQTAGEAGNDRTKARYQDSAHVKRFYETARYPK
ncbi:MAG: formate dehydrogenase [Beijerinckiaceae bacterium]